MKNLNFAFINFNRKDVHAKRFYFQVYTLVFVVSALFICSWFYLTGRTFISQGDGLYQHYPALVYYAKYLRAIIRSLFFDHQLIIPNWDFSIGEGADIIETLHYYVIGDPFAFFSVFVPTRYMYLYYEAMILLRLYLSGIAFSCLCFQTGQRNRYGILAGSMAYVFCYWALYNTVAHPYFLNPLIYMPMILTGIEKMLKKERPYTFILSVFISAISNFYFFYMLVVITIIYVFIRIFILYHKSAIYDPSAFGKSSALASLRLLYRNNIRLAALQILKIGIAAILGILMASVLFIPIFYTFLSDARMSADNVVHLFYPLSYYSGFPAHFLTSGSDYWMCMGFAAPVLVAVFLLFYQRNKNGILKTLFLISILIALFPFFGHILNGFSYVTNRWSWAFALLCSYILSAMWPALMKLKKNEVIFLFFATIIYFIICLMLEYSRTISAFTSIIFIFIFLFLLFPMGKEGLFTFVKKQQMALFLVLISIFANSFWVYASVGDDYASNGVEESQVKEEYLSIDASAVKQVAETEGTDNFWRYSGGNSLHRNGGFKTGLSSTQFYWTLSNPYVSQFRKELEMNEGRAFNYRGYDTRTSLTALASVLYYVMPEGKNSPIPYGFTYVDTIDVNTKRLQNAISSMMEELNAEELTDDQIKVVENAYSESYSVYRNDCPLPLAYTYDNVLSEETWNSLTATEKQEAMLQAVFLKDYVSSSDCEKSDLNLTNQKIDYTMTANGNGISIQDNSFVVTTANSSITLEFDGLTNSETYFSIKNLSFTGIPSYALYFGDEKDDPLNLYGKTLWNTKKFTSRETMRKENLFWSPSVRTELNFTSSTGINNNLTYDTEEYSWYNNRHDFIINMGYSDDKATSLTISFSNIGTYSFDSIEIICLPMENYVSEINELKKNVPENIVVGTDTITGSISLESPKVVCLSIPYSIGWKATIDGEDVALYQANSMYIGIPLDEGEHEILLKYSTPFLKEGAYVSGVSLLVFLFYVIFSERKKH